MYHNKSIYKHMFICSLWGSRLVVIWWHPTSLAVPAQHMYHTHTCKPFISFVPWPYTAAQCYMKDIQSWEKMGKIIPILFIIHLGFPITSHSWRIKVDDYDAYINLYECEFAETSHIIRLNYNIDTTCEVATNL